MNKVKVNDFIDVLARCKGFNTEITDIVKEYMQKVISKYEKVFPNGIDASLDNNKYFIKPVNGRYSIEDFLLNRMFRSINSMEANHVDGEVSATFYPAISKISYDKSKMVRSLYSYFLKIGREKYYILKNKDIVLKYLYDLGIYPKIKNNLYYPYSNQASSIEQIFLDELNKLSN